MKIFPLAIAVGLIVAPSASFAQNGADYGKSGKNCVAKFVQGEPGQLDAETFVAALVAEGLSNGQAHALVLEIARESCSPR